MSIHRIALGIAFSAVTTFATAAPFALATYGESYSGPKTLTVEIAPSAAGDQALIKVYGLSHPWDGKVVLTTMRRDPNNGRAEYLARVQGKEWVVLHESDRGTRLNLPGEFEKPLVFDRSASLTLTPAHIASDFERPNGAVK